MRLPNCKRPCKDCPFRTDCMPGWLGKKRMKEILNAGSFTCHKTNKALQCAGHMIIKGGENDFVRLASRLKIEIKLSGHDLIFQTKEECIKHHTKKMTTVTMSEELAKRQAMDQTIRILAEVRHFIESNNLNKSKIAEAVGLRQQHISRMTSGKHIPTLYSLLLLIKGVEIVVGYEFESASFVKSYPALKP